MDVVTRVRGCLLAGAVGDALGAPLEFLSRADILKQWGDLGPEGYVAGSWPVGSVTDDTQMTLFTAEGMIRSQRQLNLHEETDPPRVVYDAYLRWLDTQGDVVAPELLDGGLVKQEVLRHQRAPGNTCLSALRSGRMGTPERPLNDSKGCGTVMRTAPAALWDHAPYGYAAFEAGQAYGAITHGHPTGYLAGGFLASMVASLLRGEAMDVAIGAAHAALQRYGSGDARELVEAVQRAVELADGGVRGHEGVQQLGAGWVAEEALAIGIYCLLTAPDLMTGLRTAVAHGGDSDSTGAVAGYLLGAHYGPDRVPEHLVEALDAREEIEQVASDLCAHFLDPRAGSRDNNDFDRYPVD